MNAKFLKSAAVLSFISLLFAATALYYSSKNTYKKSSGELVFAQTYTQINNIGSILIHKNEDTLSLVLEDNLWRVKNEDYYYANYPLLNLLFNNFVSSKYYRPVNQEQIQIPHFLQNAVTIDVLTKDNQLLNSVLIGNMEDRGVYYIGADASTPEKLFLITGNYYFPENIYSWLQQPILQLSPTQIKQIEVIDAEKTFTLKRNNENQPFYTLLENKTLKNVNTELLLQSLNYVSAEKVISAQNFDNTLYPLQKTYKITTFDGLIVNLHLLQAENDYWAEIKLSSNNLPTSEISDYIENNTFLYDGWYFKIPFDTGRQLFNYMI